MNPPFAAVPVKWNPKCGPEPKDGLNRVQSRSDPEFWIIHKYIQIDELVEFQNMLGCQSRQPDRFGFLDLGSMVILTDHVDPHIHTPSTQCKTASFLHRYTVHGGRCILSRSAIPHLG